MEEWQSLKMLISENFPDKSYTDLWELLLTKDPYKTDSRLSQNSALLEYFLIVLFFCMCCVLNIER